MGVSNNWDELVLDVQDRCREILKDDVSPVVEKMLKDHIWKDVYLAYKRKENEREIWPHDNYDFKMHIYPRRYQLMKKVYTEMYTEIDAGDKYVGISTTSKESANTPVVEGWVFVNDHPGAFLEMLESGHTGIWKGGFARKPITNTQNEINTSSKIRSIIDKGLN